MKRIFSFSLLILFLAHCTGKNNTGATIDRDALQKEALEDLKQELSGTLPSEHAKNGTLPKDFQDAIDSLKTFIDDNIDGKMATTANKNSRQFESSGQNYKYDPTELKDDDGTANGGKSSGEQYQSLIKTLKDAGKKASPELENYLKANKPLAKIDDQANGNSYLFGYFEDSAASGNYKVIVYNVKRGSLQSNDIGSKENLEKALLEYYKLSKFEPTNPFDLKKWEADKVKNDLNTLATILKKYHNFTVVKDADDEKVFIYKNFLVTVDSN